MIFSMYTAVQSDKVTGVYRDKTILKLTTAALWFKSVCIYFACLGKQQNQQHMWVPMHKNTGSFYTFFLPHIKKVQLYIIKNTLIHHFKSRNVLLFIF